MPLASIERMREVYKYDPKTGFLTRNEPAFRAKLKVGDIVSSANPEGYLVAYIDNEKFLAHRLAWAIYYGEWPCGQLDHKNMDKKDNSLENLRLATQSENQRNKRARGDLGIKGVSKVKSGRFQARIRTKVGFEYLGTFESTDEAAHAFNKAAIKHHGDFAVLNPIGTQYEK